MSETIKISSPSMAAIKSVRDEYAARFGFLLPLKDIADVIIAHGGDGARKKLNLTNEKRTAKNRSQTR